MSRQMRVGLAFALLGILLQSFVVTRSGVFLATVIGTVGVLLILTAE